MGGDQLEDRIFPFAGIEQNKDRKVNEILIRDALILSNMAHAIGSITAGCQKYQSGANFRLRRSSSK
jgi:hypothetical protein